MLRSVIFHLFAITLTLSVIVWGAPVETGKDLDLQPKLKTLDDCYTAGTDPTNVMNDITTLVNNAGSSIRDLPTDLTGQFNGKAPDIINLWTAILTGLVEHFGKWNHKSKLNPQLLVELFSELTAQAGEAISNAQTVIAVVLSNLSEAVSSIIDAAKPHWQQLQEQIVGHGLNILGSISETVNNLHGSITGGSS